MMSAEEVAAFLNGKHLTTIRSLCPMFPRTASTVYQQHFSFDQAPVQFAGLVSHPAMHRQTEAWARVALEGARHKRGPPSVRFS
jgi:uncharacterized protein YgbK (DUF1537 family)